MKGVGKIHVGTRKEHKKRENSKKDKRILSTFLPTSGNTQAEWL